MNRRLLLCAAVVVGFAAACGGSRPASPTPIVEPPPEPPPPPPPPAPPPTLGVARILAFGDSMTAGIVSAPLPTSIFTPLDAGASVSYPFKLQALVTARYTDQAIVVVNAGNPGESATDTDTRSRFNRALSDAKPEVLLLMEGANDLNGVTPSANNTTNAMEDMVRDAQLRGIFVMLATLPPQRPGPGTKTTTPDLLARYNSNLRTMAAKKGAQLVDVNALLPVSFIGQDGLHPTEAGYDKLAEIFLDAIKSKYEKVP